MKTKTQKKTEKSKHKNREQVSICIAGFRDFVSSTKSRTLSQSRRNEI